MRAGRPHQRHTAHDLIDANLALQDFDPAVVAITSQPFLLFWTTSKGDNAIARAGLCLPRERAAAWHMVWRLHFSMIGSSTRLSGHLKTTSLAFRVTVCLNDLTYSLTSRK
jgi:hypothetical protein